MNFARIRSILKSKSEEQQQEAQEPGEEQGGEERDPVRRILRERVHGPRLTQTRAFSEQGFRLLSDKVLRISLESKMPTKLTDWLHCRCTFLDLFVYA